MRKRGGFDRIREWVASLNRGMGVLSGVAVGAMMLVVVTDVTGRCLFDRPVMGSYEMVVYLMVIAVYLGLGYAQVERSHVSIEIVVQYLGEKERAWLECATLLATLVMYGFISWASFLQAGQVRANQQVSSALAIPQWPFQLVVAVGAVVFCLTVLTDLVGAARRATGK